MDVTRPVDIASAEFKADPYPFYARARAEAPMQRVRVGETGVLAVPAASLRWRAAPVLQGSEAMPLAFVRGVARLP